MENFMDLPTLGEFHIAMLAVANRAMGGADPLPSMKPAQLINVASAVRQAADSFVRRACEEVVRQSDDARKEFDNAQI